VTQQADKPNDIGRNFLQGNRKKIAKFFNEDFYLPLYLPLWSLNKQTEVLPDEDLLNGGEDERGEEEGEG
jgi:hypothetical protein